MAEYIDREAVVRYLKGYSEKECNSNSPYGMITSSVLNRAARALSEMPATDVQSVVYCKDCLYAQNLNDTMVHCTYFEFDTAKDNFCSYAE